MVRAMVGRIVLGCVLFVVTGSAGASEPIIGGPCQGCELVFVEMPEHLDAQARIAPPGEAGEKLILSGRVFHGDGSSAGGIVVYAYQTDNEGKYPNSATFHGKLRGWALTDQQGRYSFESIRPRAYPGRDIPEHIHLHIVEPNKGTYYIDSVEFSDDPLLTDSIRSQRPCRGGCGVVTPSRNQQGSWKIQRDIMLGESIPGY